MTDLRSEISSSVSGGGVMEEIYVVLGRTDGPPCEVWAVAAYVEEEDALEHSRMAADEVGNIRNNLERALMLRGRPFSQEQIERFKAGIRSDPHARLDVDVTYEVVRVTLARGPGALREDR